MTEYDANSIETLSFRDAIRSKVAMYMGSADNQGVLQCIREIITNSIDEATMGFGNEIAIKVNTEKNEVTVSDKGRGVPFGIRDDGIEALEAVYTMPHSGGKFNNKIYQNVAGLNGIGAKGTALTSSYFKVCSYRDHKVATLELVEGTKTKFRIQPLGQNEISFPTGTVVTFIPSPEVYNLEPIHIDMNEVHKMCRDWAYLMKGIKFSVSEETSEGIKEKIYLYKNGLLDMIKDNNKKSLNRVPLYGTSKEGDIEIELAMEWTDSREEEWHVFTNGLENTEGGTPITGIKTALTNFFKKKVQHDIPPDILRKGLYYIVSCKLPNPSFANQTKTKVNNIELRGCCQRLTTQILDDYARRNPTDFNQIIDLLSKEVRAEVAAERARRQILDATKDIEKNQKRKVFSSDKLKDAEFLGQDSMLLVVEGLSALHSLAQARDCQHIGLMAIKGKILNPLSNPEEKVFQNEEIKLLLSAMNIVPNKYNASKLRYGKIGICVDAD